MILDSRKYAEHFKEKVGSHRGCGTTLIIKRVHLLLYIAKNYYSCLDTNNQ